MCTHTHTQIHIHIFKKKKARLKTGKKVRIIVLGYQYVTALADRIASSEFAMSLVLSRVSRELLWTKPGDKYISYLRSIGEC